MSAPTKPETAAEKQSRAIAEYVDRLVAQAPPLSPEQKARIAVLLRVERPAP